ncbi:MAG: hypothetical protein LCH69_12100 [Proteobacteria bacterium]|nr:hypothetical protein [Pseudomonadota bacterium]
MKRSSLVTAGLLALGACTSDPGFTGVGGVREISSAEAASCSYVSDFRMTPGVYGPLAGQGLRYARNKVMSDARDAGANAIIFDAVAPGADVYEVHAVAYRC